MSKLPSAPSPSVLLATAPDVLTLPTGTELWRVYFRGGRYPTSGLDFRYWGPTSSRFDHQVPPTALQDRGVMYAAPNARVSLAEVFQRHRRINRHRCLPALCGFATTRDLRLLNLTGPWPTRAGASQALCVGSRSRTRPWARAIYDAWPDLDGIWYRSCMDGEGYSAALFERAEDALPNIPIFDRQLNDPALLITLKNAALTLGYDLF